MSHGPARRRLRVLALPVAVAIAATSIADSATASGPAGVGGATTRACETTQSRKGRTTLPKVYRAATEGRTGELDLTDATEAWGALEPLTGMHGHAVATGDVNGDGWTDVFVGTFADRPEADYQARGASGPAPDRLLLGGPDGFQLDPTFPEELARTSGAAFADLDGDGDLDLVVARNVRDARRGTGPTRIYRNDGGRLTRATTLSEPRGARSIGLLDYDADGRLDLFVTEDPFSGGSSVLLRNEGGFGLVDVTEQAGIGRGVAGMGVGTADLDGDGRPDLFVGGSNRLFLNRGGGRFEEARSNVEPWPTFGDEDVAAGVAVGDVNLDGRPDVVVGQHYNSTLDSGRRVPVRLYLNEPSGSGMELRDVTEDAGLVGFPTKSPHVEIADVNADGRPDIVTTAAGADGRPVVFLQTGDGPTPRFEPSSAPGPEQYWVTGATLDADRDGRLDILVVEWEPSLPTLFLRNTGDVGRWLGITLPATATVQIFEAGKLRKAGALLATATAGDSTGYGAGPPDRVWFGTGERKVVDVLIALHHHKAVKLRRVRVDRQLVCRA